MNLLTAVVALATLGLHVFFKAARIIFGLTFLGAILGMCGATVALSKASERPWEPLGMPSAGAVEIVLASDDAIYVRAVDGETYSCDFRVRTRCWVRSQSGEPQLTEEPPAPSYVYDATSQVSVSERSASIRYWHFEGGTSYRDFELRADGGLWTRVRGTNPMISLYVLTMGALAGAILGLASGMLIAVVRFLRKRAPPAIAAGEKSDGL